MRFSLGKWDAESWGARPWGGTREGGTGVELWAWVEAETDEEFVILSFFMIRKVLTEIGLKAGG